MRMKLAGIAVAMTVIAAHVQPAAAAELKVLTAGAYKPTLLALAAKFERQTGDKVVVENDTVGGLVKRIEAGDPFDVVIVSPTAIEDLVKTDKIVPGSGITLARTGIGVVVKEGAAKPDISTVAAFKQALLDANSIAYIDPASGGSSGIYIAGLLARLGIADALKPKTKLTPGGLVAEHIADGEAQLGIAQTSEIAPVRGVTLVGPLPAEIQSYTTYAAGIGAASQEGAAAKALITLLAGPEAASVLRQNGMEKPGA